MKTAKLLVTAIILCGVIASGFTAAFAGGYYPDDFYSSYDYYLKYSQPTGGKTTSDGGSGSSVNPASAPTTAPATSQTTVPATTPATAPTTAPATSQTTVPITAPAAANKPGTPAEQATGTAAESASGASQAKEASGLSGIKGLADEEILALLIKRIELFISDADKGEVSPGEVSPGEVSSGGVSPGGVSSGGVSPGEVSADMVSVDGVLPGGISPILINITSPDVKSAEIVYKNAYSICGVRDDEADPEEAIILFLTRFDAKTDSYVGTADINGEMIWTIGSNGVFTRSVLLEDGDNKFAIAACKASVIEAARTDGRVIGDDEVQLEVFIIVYRSQSVAEKISEVLKELTLANIKKEIESQ